MTIGNNGMNEPMRLWTGQVLAEWLDYNGHMTEHRYLQVFGESSDALYARIGIDFENAHSGAYYTLTTHLRHISECKEGTHLWSDTEILSYDEKRLHIYHRLFDGDGKLLATGEHLSIHIRGSKACGAPSHFLKHIANFYAPRANEPWPNGTGSVLKNHLSVSRYNHARLQI